LLARDPSLREEMGRRGRARAIAQFSTEQMVDRFISLYEEIAR